MRLPQPIPLEDVCDIVMGQAPSGTSYNDEGKGHPLIAGAGDFDGIYPAAKRFTTEAVKLSQCGDIILAIRATIGETVWADKTYCLGRGVAALRPHSSLDKTFLWHWIPTVRAELNRRAKGATFKQVTKDDIATLRVALPPLSEQRRIADILDRAESLRTKRRTVLEQLTSLSESLFISIFGDPVSNPKRHPLVPMGEVCDVRDGTHDSPRYISEGGYPLVTSKNLTSGVVDLTEVSYISEEDYRQINRRSRVDRGDILLPMIGTIGSPVLVRKEPHYAIKNVALIKFDSRSPLQEFLLHLLRSHYFDWVVSQKNRGGTQKFVSLGDLRAFPLPLPPKHLQERFAHRLNSVEQLRSVALESLSQLDDIFASLQHRAFRGEL